MKFKKCVEYYIAIAALVILVVVLYINHRQNPPRRHTGAQPAPTAGAMAESYPDTKDLIGDSTLTPDDLDFWDMYPEETPEPEKEAGETPKPQESDPSTDGRWTGTEKKSGY